MVNYVDRGYYNTMDREYSSNVGERIAPQDIAESISFIDADFMGKLKASIFRGASKGELVFWAQGKSSQQPAPETISKEERQAIRDMALVNEMKLTTHATVAVTGVAGLGKEGFSEATRKESVTEIKRAIDFAADATTGGAVVFHTGEFPRTVKEVKERYPFSGRELKEDETELGAIRRLIDKREGKVINAVRDREALWIPEYEKDENGRPIYSKEKDPIYDRLNGDISDEKKLLPKFKYNRDGTVKLRKVTYQDYLKERKEDDPEVSEKEILKDFFIETQRPDLLQQYNYAREYDFNRQDAENQLESYKREKKKLTHYQKLLESDDEFVDRLYEQKKQRDSDLTKQQFIEDQKKEIELKLNENEHNIKKTDQRRKHSRDFSTSYMTKFNKQVHDKFKNVETLEDYSMKKTSKSMAELGLFAMDRSERARESMPEQYKEQFQDIFVAPENMFPEQFGGHPQELRKIVHEGRKAMAERLEKERGYTKEEAKETAAKHIKATFDTGHANVWWKYFDHDPDKSIEENRKEYNKWLVSEFKQLVKEGVIGHVHLTDNLGYNDEHLVAGQGSTPIKDLLKAIEEEKPELLKEMVVESGTLNYKTILQDTWAELSSPVYSLHKAPGARSVGFADISHSYLGSTGSPRFIFGEYAPSKEYVGEPFWSGIGLE